MFFFFLQCFETIECAYDWVVTEELENQIIFVHSGMYHREYLFIDTNVAIIGAGKFILYTGLYIQFSASCLHSTSLSLSRTSKK